MKSPDAHGVVQPIFETSVPAIFSLVSTPSAPSTGSLAPALVSEPIDFERVYVATEITSGEGDGVFSSIYEDAPASITLSSAGEQIDSAPFVPRIILSTTYTESLRSAPAISSDAPLMRESKRLNL